MEPDETPPEPHRLTAPPAYGTKAWDWFLLELADGEPAGTEFLVPVPSHALGDEPPPERPWRFVIPVTPNCRHTTPRIHPLQLNPPEPCECRQGCVRWTVTGWTKDKPDREADVLLRIRLDGIVEPNPPRELGQVGGAA